MSPQTPDPAPPERLDGAATRAQPLIDVRDLAVSFKVDGGIVDAVKRVSFQLYRGETVAIVGEFGIGQIRHGSRRHGAAERRATVKAPSRILLDGEDMLRFSPKGATQAARRTPRDDLPGTDELAQPGLYDRRADRRGDPHPSDGSRASGAGARARIAGGGQHTAAGGAAASIPAPIIGRPAPARDDRHGARQPAGRADRRRADDCARRDGAGANPGADARSATPSRHGDHSHHPRSDDRSTAVRGLRLCHATRRGEGAQRHRSAVRRSAPSLHDAAPEFRAARRRARDPSDAPDRSSKGERCGSPSRSRRAAG